MYFITNRIPNEGLKTELPRTISFNPQIVTADQDVFFCANNVDQGGYTEIGKDNFFEVLKDCDYKQILLFLHRFNNTVEVALGKAELLQALEDGMDGEYVPQFTRNTVVYYSSDDYALAKSKIVNIKNHQWGRRLGLTGPKDMHKVPKNVYEVDCDDFNNDFDFPGGHTYFLDKNGTNDASPIINHIVTAITTGRIEPANRSQRLSEQ